MNKPTAIVLGGTAPHIALIENLKARGYYTVLVDYLENPPAKSFADEHVLASTLDKQAVLDVSKRLNASLVISACIDQANVTACYVAEQLGLPSPYSYKTALEVSNKGLMKEIMLENGIQTSKYAYIDSINKFDESKLSFPVVVKPADSCGSSGVRRVNKREDIDGFFNLALNISRAGKVVIEEIVEGVEVSAYCFIQDKRAQVIMISERLSIIDGYEEVIKCYATITPPDISEIAKTKIQQVANQIGQIFNLDNTPLHLQVFVDGEKINVIEFAPRAGGGMSYKTIKSNTGFDIIDATVNSFLGLKSTVDLFETNIYYSINLIYANEGVFDHIEGHEELLAKGVIDELFFYKSFGSFIRTDTASRSRVGSYIIKADTRTELYSKISLAASKLQVYDDKGNAMMNKRVYLDNPEINVNQNADS